MEYLPIMRTLLVKYALLLCNCYQYIRYQWHMYYYTNSLYLLQYTCSHVFAWHINPRNQYYISNTFIWHKSILLFVQEWIIQAPTTGNNNECPFFFLLGVYLTHLSKIIITTTTWQQRNTVAYMLHWEIYTFSKTNLGFVIFFKIQNFRRP